MREHRFARGIRALALSVAVNLTLIALKGTVGVLGHSQALVADAVHSGADLANALVALGSLLVSRRPADPTHPYGHGRAEALAANVAAMVIGAAGAVVGWEAVTTLLHGHAERPDLAALAVGFVAAVIKFGLALYALRIARAIRSKAVNADARDHLADVVSALVVVAGIAAARLGAPLLDPFAGLVVAGFILYTAGEIFLNAARELMDTSLAPEVRSAVIGEVHAVPGIRISGVAGRTIGDITIVEVHADVDPQMSVGDAAKLTDQIKARLVGKVADISHVVVELNSCAEEPEALRVDSPAGEDLERSPGDTAKPAHDSPRHT